MASTYGAASSVSIGSFRSQTFSFFGFAEALPGSLAVRGCPVSWAGRHTSGLPRPATLRHSDQAPFGAQKVWAGVDPQAGGGPFLCRWTDNQQLLLLSDQVLPAAYICQSCRKHHQRLDPFNKPNPAQPVSEPWQLLRHRRYVCRPILALRNRPTPRPSGKRHSTLGRPSRP